jgi:histidine ammonia-lyase
VRNFVEFANEDRIFGDDIHQLHQIIRDFSFVKHCNAVCNEKGIGLNKGYEEFSI